MHVCVRASLHISSDGPQVWRYPGQQTIYLDASVFSFDFQDLQICVQDYRNKVRACVHVCMCACVYVCLFICIGMFMRACMHACMYVCVCVCMFQRIITQANSNGSITHSGDVIDHVKKEGVHTIKICLNDLPEKV